MVTRRRRLGAVLVIPTLGIPLTAARADAYTPPSPPTKQLPSALDVAVPYQGQTLCDPVARTGVLAFAQLMTSHYGMGNTGLIERTCGSDVSEHYDGRAWDWMLNVNNVQQEAVAQSVLNWLTGPDAQGRPGGMARRFGIMYIIHNKKIWRSYDTGRADAPYGWGPYSGASPHTDHIHFSFTYDGAAKRTSWWTGVATTSYLTSLPPATPSGTVTLPAPTAPYLTLSYDTTSDAVSRLQTALGGLPVTGWYGPQTTARVKAYQTFIGVPVTGTADVRTQERLFSYGWSAAARLPRPHTPSPQSAQPVAPKAAAAPQLAAPKSMAVPPPAAPKSMAVPPPAAPKSMAVEPPAAPKPTATRTPAPETTYSTLKYGMTSESVRRLQAALGNLPTTAWYGPMTTARVKAFQKFAGLPVTGVADAATQRRLFGAGWATKGAAQSYPTLRYGMTSESVRKLQAALGALPTTAWFGTMTEARVKQYQKFVGLKITGVADAQTQQALFTKGWSTAAAVAYMEPEVPDVPASRAFAVLRTPTMTPAVATVSTTTAYTPYKDVVLALGARGAAVRFLQRALGGLAVDGVFGTMTQRAVTALQVAEVMAATGVVTPEVWDVLEQRDFPFAANRATVLRPGDTGPAVAEVQRVLGVPVTGTYDAATRDAVKAAQARGGLASTGVVASRTWSLFDRLSA
ncbi:MAG: peptidoglycan-binding protein [Intrasporangium sp.]|uniref:peptidoglycan-binding domain-containing protein n=1 Tax=Intrasporangium sp. TaxID=1925024 RepID=UPI003F805413